MYTVNVLDVRGTNGIISAIRSIITSSVMQYMLLPIWTCPEPPG